MQRHQLKDELDLTGKARKGIPDGEDSGCKGMEAGRSGCTWATGWLVCKVRVRAG